MTRNEKEIEFERRAALIEKSVEWWEKEFDIVIKQYEEAELLGKSKEEKEAKEKLLRIYKRCEFERLQLAELEVEMVKWMRDKDRGRNAHFEIIRKKSNGKKSNGKK